MTDEAVAPYKSEWKILSANEQENDDGILHFHTVGSRKSEQVEVYFTVGSV